MGGYVHNPGPDLTAALAVVDGNVDDIEAALVVVDGNVDDLLTNLQVVDDIVDAIEPDVTAILAVTTGLPILYETGTPLTTDGTVQNLYVNNAPSGIFEPIGLLIDFTNHTAGETVMVRLLHRMKSGGNYIEFDFKEFAGVQDPLGKYVSLGLNRFGVKVTMEKTNGVNKVYDTGVFYRL